MSKISPQGYTYGDDPKSTNPFWSDEADFDPDTPSSTTPTQITASASVSNTTGKPSVKVDTTTDDGTTNIDFSFSGLKGEKGDKGDTGETGSRGLRGLQGETGPAGPQGPAGETGPEGPAGADGKNGENGTDGVSPVVESTGNTGSGEIAGTITGANGTVMNVYNGAQGETGPQGPQGETGPAGPQGPAGTGADIDTSEFVTDVSITNENGVYGFKQTKNGETEDIGSVEVPNVDNVLAEINDDIVENAEGGYDYHTIKETEHNGVQNNVGSFYLARKQITELNSDGTFKTVDQSGTEGEGKLEISGGSGITGISPNYELPSYGDFSSVWKNSLYKNTLLNNVIYFPRKEFLSVLPNSPLYEATKTVYTYTGDTPPTSFDFTVPSHMLEITQVKYIDGTTPDILSYVSIDITIKGYKDIVLSYNRLGNEDRYYYYSNSDDFISSVVQLPAGVEDIYTQAYVSFRTELDTTNKTITVSLKSLELWMGSYIAEITNAKKNDIYADDWKFSNVVEATTSEESS